VEKRYQVFVSSTYEDLREERQEVMQALLELDCIPSGMELFPAANEDQWTLIKGVIDDCDYYIVIVAGRYGSTARDGKSYTQMEYEYALSKNKPVIAFLHGNADAIPAGKSEKDGDGKKRLEEFCQLARQRMVKTWESPAELGSVVSRSIVKLMKDHPAVGWVRADVLAEELAGPELLRLRKQNEELQVKLDRSRSHAPAGAETLAQGEDKFELQFSIRYWDGSEWNEVRAGHSLDWNTIFKLVAPLMIERSAQSELAAPIVRFTSPSLKAALTRRQRLARDLTSKLQPESLHTIIIQLRALGLIVRDDRTKSLRDSQTYWALTAYGDTVMTRLTAIRGASSRSEEVAS
jgi:hypothetical protein